MSQLNMAIVKVVHGVLSAIRKPLITKTLKREPVTSMARMVQESFPSNR